MTHFQQDFKGTVTTLKDSIVQCKDPVFELLFFCLGLDLVLYVHFEGKDWILWCFDLFRLWLS